ncbi:MAG: hypothetical protein JWR72_1181 [Flavisolibacter sp.]|jgi:hypothetical protein|nr:hypothetical protein [Flavisolibacter sp.]
MKKLLIILCLFVSIANYAQAQTKEETITWLQQKLQKYSTGGSMENIVVKVSECSITFSYTYLRAQNIEEMKY